jgi:hypothetical protein
VSSQLDYKYGDAYNGIDGSPKDAFGNKAQGRASMGDKLSYGGSAHAAEAEAGRLRGERDGWDNAYAGVQGIDYSQADAARGQAQQARGEQMYGQGMALAMEQGGGPSAATAQYAMNTDAAMQAQASQGGLGAQRSGVQQAGAAMGALGGARAAETGAGRQAYIGGAGDMRGGDLGQASMDWGQQQAQSKDFYQKRGLTDEMSQFYNEQEYGARAAQLNAQVNAREINRVRYGQRQQAEDDRDTVGRDVTTGVVAGLGTVAGAVGGFFTGGPPGAVAGGVQGLTGALAAAATKRK